MPLCSFASEFWWLERNRRPHWSSAAAFNTTFPDVCDLAAELSFAEERRRRLLYRDEGLHLSVLHLVFTLLLDAQGQLDRCVPSAWPPSCQCQCTPAPAVCWPPYMPASPQIAPVSRYLDPYPWERKLPNVPFTLACHLNHEDNRRLLPRLLPQLAALGPSAMRLLRTLCSALFRPEWYGQRWRLSGAAGAYATIYRCQLPAWAGEGQVVLKLVDTPQHVQASSDRGGHAGRARSIPICGGAHMCCHGFCGHVMVPSVFSDSLSRATAGPLQPGGCGGGGGRAAGHVALCRCLPAARLWTGPWGRCPDAGAQVLLLLSQVSAALC